MSSPAGRLVPGVRRIAVLRANSIGDFVLVLPALAALRAAYPQASISYLGADWHADYLTGRPGPWDEVTVVPPYAGVRGDGPADRPAAAAFFAAAKARGYDLAIQLHGGGANSNPFLSRLGARVTVGSRDRGAPPLDRTVAYTAYQHEVWRFLEVVGLVGATSVGFEPRLAVTAADRAEAAGVLPAGRLVAVHPGANDVRRRWPPASFAAVADALAARGATVVLIGAPGEKRLAGAVADAMATPAVDLSGALSLGGTTALLAACELLVGNDSGPRHIAAAVGTATVSVYLCGNLLNAGPLLRDRHRVAVSFRTACPVCGADHDGPGCNHSVSFVADIGVADVRDHALELFGC